MLSFAISEQLGAHLGEMADDGADDLVGALGVGGRAAPHVRDADADVPCLVARDQAHALRQAREVAEPCVLVAREVLRRARDDALGQQVVGDDEPRKTSGLWSTASRST